MNPREDIKSGQHTSARVFVAEILNLAFLGFLKFEKVSKEKLFGMFGKDYDYKVFFAQPKKSVTLTSSQEKVLGILKSFGGENEFLFSKLESNARFKRASFASSFKSWQRKLKPSLMKWVFLKKTMLCFF